MNIRSKRSSFVKAALAAACVFSFAVPAFAQGTQTLVIEPDQGLTSIYNLINAAKSTIDMTMYELQDTTAQNDLCNAVARGVKVRVILDVNLEKSNNTAAYNQLKSCGASVTWAWTHYQATHQKTITIDAGTSNAQTAIMTLNLTSRYYSTSRDFAVIENDSKDIAAIEATFSKDFAHASVTPTNGDDLVWSPTNSQTSLLNIINNAQTSLLVENEEMSDSAIVNALANACSKGVSVNIAMVNDDNDYASEFDTLTNAGCNVSTYPDTSTGFYIHAKAIVADYGTAHQVAFVGSENFSSASLTENRELGLTTTNASIISQLESTMSNDYAGGTPW
ncbi:MAG TPA: phospholipase D-like domain-containing protein [Dyella sp.]|uniref:phospholipase D-like domain-containing protein n=1 Tax=Dyella sp. TaxID=1869338 RepID=UPI002CDB397D|nr:phospholipase D-like domain-containing protein [Dyella sp.]HUB91247.1 phospholipase D-like domain-containing protein [Dyella sp.]